MGLLWLIFSSFCLIPEPGSDPTYVPSVLAAVVELLFHFMISRFLLNVILAQFSHSFLPTLYLLIFLFGHPPTIHGLYTRASFFNSDNTAFFLHCWEANPSILQSLHMFESLSYFISANFSYALEFFHQKPERSGFSLFISILIHIKPLPICSSCCCTSLHCQFFMHFWWLTSPTLVHEFESKNVSI